MSGIVQEPGFDTKVQQFTPIRNAPVWRRAVRKYDCLEDVTGTSNFSQLQFKIHCSERNLVCNDARIVFPLELRAWTGDPDDDTVVSSEISMAVNDGMPACNIAIAQNSPWNAFETVVTVVNTKVYTEQPRAYGRMLSNNYQSVSEMQFMNNHSLKPWANVNLEAASQWRDVINVVDDGGEETGDQVTVLKHKFDVSTFVLENANSGFLERSRQFQDSLDTTGKVWSGEISSLLNCGPFSAEARGAGNDQIPYIQDLFLNLVFKQTKCQLDAKMLPSQGADYRKVIIQSLFEFLTPASATLFRQGVHPSLQFPKYYTLSWRKRPYVQIEWLSYPPAAMLPMYRLQGFQYKLVKSNEFSMPLGTSFSPRVSTQCLAVPNKIYIWGQLTENSARDSFLFGGMFRTMEIANKSLMVRVNGESHVIDRPDSQSMLFKWWKRHSNSVAEYPTWSKSPVIIITPNEVGLSNWLENDAVLSTVEISCDVLHSRLQFLEYGALEKEEILLQSGIDQESDFTQRALANMPYLYGHDLEPTLSDQFGKSEMGSGTHMHISLEQHEISILDNANNTPFVPSTDSAAMQHFSLWDFQHQDSNEYFTVTATNRCLVKLKNSVWVKYNKTTGRFVSKLFFVQNSYLFEFVDSDDERNGFKFAPWGVITGVDNEGIPEIFLDSSTGEAVNLAEFITYGSTYAFQDLTEPKANFNYSVTMPGGNTNEYHKGSAPGPSGVPLSGDGTPFNYANGEQEIPYYDDDSNAIVDAGKYTTIWGEQGHETTQYETDLVWVCMEPVKEDNVSAGQYTSTNGFAATIVQGLYKTSVLRGQKHTAVRNIEYGQQQGDNRLLVYEHGEKTGITNTELKYELNMLVEYSNQQIVMGASRNVAVRLENNVPVAL